MNIFIVTSGAYMNANLIEAHASIDTAKAAAESVFRRLAQNEKQRQEAEDIIGQGWMEIPVPDDAEKTWALRKLYELHPNIPAIEIIETELVMPTVKVN